MTKQTDTRPANWETKDFLDRETKGPSTRRMTEAEWATGERADAERISRAKEAKADAATMERLVAEKVRALRHQKAVDERAEELVAGMKVNSALAGLVNEGVISVQTAARLRRGK